MGSSFNRIIIEQYGEDNFGLFINGQDMMGLTKAKVSCIMEALFMLTFPEPNNNTTKLKKKMDYENKS